MRTLAHIYTDTGTKAGFSGTAGGAPEAINIVDSADQLQVALMLPVNLAERLTVLGRLQFAIATARELVAKEVARAEPVHDTRRDYNPFDTSKTND